MHHPKSPDQNLITFTIEDRSYETLTTPKFRKRKPYVPPDPKKVHCVIPGIIQQIYVNRGTQVKQGQHLLMLEAMKMQNDIVAHCDGKVKEIHVRLGSMATKGEVLLEFE
jgi:pyruvate carboxylase